MNMRGLTLEKIAAVCGGEAHNIEAVKDREAAGVVIDSRKTEADFVFIATKGARADGHAFIPAVMRQGALGVVCERTPGESETTPYILVKDSFSALKKIAAAYRESLRIPIVGVTGSVGKTSTKECIASVLSQKYNVLKTKGNFNNEIGLPLTLLEIREEHEAAVVEMGINHFGEMTRLSEIAKPDICVITNIGECHLEALGDRDGVLKAKTEIFTHMRQDGRVVLNGDDDKLRTVREVNGKAPLFYGTGEDAAVYGVYGRSIENKGLFGTLAEITLPENAGGRFSVDIPLPGAHMLSNALAAAAVGELLGVSVPQIKKGIESVEPVGGRSRILTDGRYTIIDDCYNANPVSVRAALDLLSLAKTRTVAILGDMLELGENERALHEDVGKYVLDRGINVLVAIGALAEDIYLSALTERWALDETTLIGIFYFKDKAAFLKDAEKILRDGDTILLKASHSMGFEELTEALEKGAG